MIEQNTVARVDPIRLAIIDRDPVGIQLRDRVRRPRIKRRRLLLRYLLNETIELAGARLIEPRLFLHAEHANRFENTQRAERVGIRGVFRLLKADRDMALRREIVDLRGLHLFDDVDEARRIGHVAMMQHEATSLFVRILIQVVDAIGIEQRRSTLDAVHLVAFCEQKFGEICAVLSGDPGDQCFLAHWFVKSPETRRARVILLTILIAARAEVGSFPSKPYSRLAMRYLPWRSASKIHTRSTGVAPSSNATDDA